LNKQKSKAPIICYCNYITQELVEIAIAKGARNLTEIYDETTAGTGPCGGSCRNNILQLIQHYIENGDFSHYPSPNTKKKRRYK